MAKKINAPLAAAVGAAFATSVAGVSAQASENPFSITELSSGYMVAENQPEGKCGEGKCGGSQAQEREKEKEGKCGGNQAQEREKTREGKCGASE